MIIDDESTLFLYKYTKVNQYLFENLINCTLMFSKPTDFNDPFDCDAPMIYGVESDEIIIESYFDEMQEFLLPDLCLNLPKEEYLKRWKNDPVGFEAEMHKTVKTKYVLNAGILSLSKDSTNIKMWSHYADAHKGVCLEFDVRQRIYNESERYNNDPYQVNYPENDYYPNFLDKNVTAGISLWGQFLTKSKDWVEEKECRVFSSTSGLKRFNNYSLRRIIFGINTSKEAKRTLMKLAEKLDYPNLTFAQCVKSKTKFEINIQDISNIGEVENPNENNNPKAVYTIYNIFSFLFIFCI